MGSRRRLAVLGVLGVIVAAAFATIGGAGTGSGVSAGAQIKPLAGRDEAGLAYFELKGQRLRYWVVIYDADPNSVHAAHIHGPRGACTPASKNRDVVVPFPDLEANANGVISVSGSVSLREAAIKQVLRKGFYFNVHESSTPDGVGAGITCGNIRLG